MRRAPRSVVTGLFVLTLLAAPAPVLGEPTASEAKRALKSGDQATVTSTLSGLEGQLDADLLKAILDAAPRLKTLGVYDALLATLGTARGEALDELVKGYERQRQPDLRFLIVDAMGKVPEQAAEGVLLDALREDEDESVAVLATRHLGRRGTASAVEALILILEEFEGELARRGGGRARRPQGGVVLHVLSHFKLQEDDDGDGFALQQILLNLIVDKQDRRRAELAGGD